MKKTYSKPVMAEEEFLPNSYVAACGDSGTIFNFTCNAPIKGNHGFFSRYDNVYYWPESSFNPASGNIPSISSYSGTNAKYLSGYHPCGTAHEAKASSYFYLGYVDRDDDGKYDEGEGVVIWRGERNDNTHCTPELDVTKWETAKS